MSDILDAILNHLKTKYNVCEYFLDSEDPKLQDLMCDIIMKHHSTCINYYHARSYSYSLLHKMNKYDNISLQTKSSLIHAIIDNYKKPSTNEEQKIMIETIKELAQLLKQISIDDFIMILNEISVFPTDQISEYEELHNVIFDKWVESNYISQVKCGKFLSYHSTLKKYEQIGFKNLEDNLYNVDENSKLYLEDIIDLLKQKGFNVSYLLGEFNYAIVPMKNPYDYYIRQTSLYRKELICKNPCLKSDDILKIFFKTQSMKLKELLLKHPNCPATLKLKYFKEGGDDK